MCFPDYEKSKKTIALNNNAKPKSWGYNFEEILKLTDSTIGLLRPSESYKIMLVGHDWGSIFLFSALRKSISRKG